jgi:mRNA-degrading endonuclease toxin of MazEF toxin-antitoxin module
MRQWAPWLLVLAAAAGAVAWWWRARRTPRPAPREIWWADVPYADGSGSKVRPCLVLRRGWRGVTVLKITSQDKSRRRDHLPIPTRAWDRHARRDSWVNLGEPIVVPPRAFERRVGTCEAGLWGRIEDTVNPRAGGTAARR